MRLRYKCSFFATSMVAHKPYASNPKKKKPTPPSSQIMEGSRASRSSKSLLLRKWAFLRPQIRVFPFPSFYFNFNLITHITVIFWFVLAACAAINDFNKPKEGETARQKRARLNMNPQAKLDAPTFLRPHVPENELGDDESLQPKGAVIRPNWGFRKGDSVAGSTKHSMN